MEILKIADDRMKITLTKEDLSEYALDGAELDYARPETKRALDALLTIARIRAGMPLLRGRTYIQLYPAKDGGCEIFVSQKAKCAEICALPSPAAERGGYICFPSKSEEAKICAIFRNAGVCGSLYLDSAGELCLFCRANERTLPLLEEHGTKVGDAVEVYLREHYLSLGAVQNLNV